ncbi:hypothetical protein ACFQU2_05655 [Siccirubricoccus deserti]
MAEPVIGMDKDELKVLLRKSKSEPVNCAVAASGEDRTLGVIVLDKVKAPKAVSTQLEKRYPKATLVRWGKAEVDTENDPKLVIFTLNKNVTGLGKKLKKSLKGTGYTKVLINFEDGSPSEQELEEEGVQPGVGATPGAPPPSSMAEESESAEAKSADPPPRRPRSMPAPRKPRAPNASPSRRSRPRRPRPRALRSRRSMWHPPGPGSAPAPRCRPRSTS